MEYNQRIKHHLKYVYFSEKCNRFKKIVKSFPQLFVDNLFDWLLESTRKHKNHITSRQSVLVSRTDVARGTLLFWFSFHTVENPHRILSFLLRKSWMCLAHDYKVRNWTKANSK